MLHLCLSQWLGVPTGDASLSWAHFSTSQQPADIGEDVVWRVSVTSSFLGTRLEDAVRDVVAHGLPEVCHPDSFFMYFAHLVVCYSTFALLP